MAASDDLEFLLLDFPETFAALTECGESPSLLVSENEHNDFVGFVHGSAATSDLYPSTLTENSNADQETLRITSSYNQETAIVAQNHRFDQEDDYFKYFNTSEFFCDDMLSCVLSNGEREAERSGNCVLTSSEEMMTTALQSTDLQHGALKQSYQQPFLSQTNPSLAIVPYVSAMVMGNIQEVEKANGPTNANLIHGRRDDHQFHPSSQAEQYYHSDLLLEQLRRIHETDHQMRRPKFSSISTPTSVGALLNNSSRIPFASTPKAKKNPEYHIPVISNTLTLKKSDNFSSITPTSYEPDSFANDFQNSSSLNLTRRTRGRPKRYQSSMPLSLTSTTPDNMSLVPMPLSLTTGSPKNMSLVPTTQTLLTPHSPYCAKEKGIQHDIAMPSLNPTLDNDYLNSYKKSMVQQSGGVRPRSCYDQFENGGSSSKTRRIMFPFQEKTIADSSIIPFGQVGHTRSSPANHRQERIENSVYDPLYASLGLPVDPHLRSFY